jgi:Fe-S-cluster containining protein
LQVAIRRTEAEQISLLTNRPFFEPRRPIARVGEKVVEAGYDNPCVFLDQGRCSIYEHRPLVCRAVVNMDTTPKLCELVPGSNVPVPYADFKALQRFLILLCSNETVADIRDWFRDRG